MHGSLGFAPPEVEECGCSVPSGEHIYRKEAHETGFGEEGRVPQEALPSAHSNAFVGAISNYLMFESNHFLDLANRRYFFPSRAKYLHYIFFSIIK